MPQVRIENCTVRGLRIRESTCVCLGPRLQVCSTYAARNSLQGRFSSIPTGIFALAPPRCARDVNICFFASTTKTVRDASLETSIDIHMARRATGIVALLGADTDRVCKLRASLRVSVCAHIWHRRALTYGYMTKHFGHSREGFKDEQSAVQRGRCDTYATVSRCVLWCRKHAKSFPSSGA